MIDCGLRVVRGPNWCWENQDGGEGYVGTVSEIVPSEPRNSDKFFVVQWDNGNRTKCRAGHLGKFDLRVIDNAQIGAMHIHVVCDGCVMKGIIGMRYKCLTCPDYDLCYMCYHGDKHNLTHPFKKFDYDFPMGINLPPRLNARKCELKGIFKGSKIVPGYDWEWGKQDGGEGRFGIVVDIRNWDSRHNSFRSAANVRWFSGNYDVYRLGHKGYCDVKFVEPSSGGYYYPEHLPILGQRDEEMELKQILEQIKQLVSEVKVEQAESKQTQDPALSNLGPIGSMHFSKIMKYIQALNQGRDQLINLNEVFGVSNEFK